MAYLGEIALFSPPPPPFFFFSFKASTKDSKAEKACFSLSFPHPYLSLCPALEKEEDRLRQPGNG